MRCVARWPFAAPKMGSFWGPTPLRSRPPNWQGMVTSQSSENTPPPLPVQEPFTLNPIHPSCVPAATTTGMCFVLVSAWPTLLGWEGVGWVGLRAHQKNPKWISNFWRPIQNLFFVWTKIFLVSVWWWVLPTPPTPSSSPAPVWQSKSLDHNLQPPLGQYRFCPGSISKVDPCPMLVATTFML